MKRFVFLKVMILFVMAVSIAQVLTSFKPSVLAGTSDHNLFQPVVQTPIPNRDYDIDSIIDSIRDSDGVFQDLDVVMPIYKTIPDEYLGEYGISPDLRSAIDVVLAWSSPHPYNLKVNDIPSYLDSCTTKQKEMKSYQVLQSVYDFKLNFLALEDITVSSFDITKEKLKEYIVSSESPNILGMKAMYSEYLYDEQTRRSIERAIKVIRSNNYKVCSKGYLIVDKSKDRGLYRYVRDMGYDVDSKGRPYSGLY